MIVPMALLRVIALLLVIIFRTAIVHRGLAEIAETIPVGATQPVRAMGVRRGVAPHIQEVTFVIVLLLVIIFPLVIVLLLVIIFPGVIVLLLVVIVIVLLLVDLLHADGDAYRLVGDLISTASHELHGVYHRLDALVHVHAVCADAVRAFQLADLYTDHAVVIRVAKRIHQPVWHVVVLLPVVVLLLGHLVIVLLLVAIFRRLPRRRLLRHSLLCGLHRLHGWLCLHGLHCLHRLHGLRDFALAAFVAFMDFMLFIAGAFPAGFFVAFIDFTSSPAVPLRKKRSPCASPAEAMHQRATLADYFLDRKDR